MCLRESCSSSLGLTRSFENLGIRGLHVILRYTIFCQDNAFLNSLSLVNDTNQQPEAILTSYSFKSFIFLKFVCALLFRGNNYKYSIKIQSRENWLVKSSAEIRKNSVSSCLKYLKA